MFDPEAWLQEQPANPAALIPSSPSSSGFGQDATAPDEKGVRKHPSVTHQVVGNVLVVWVQEPDLNDEITVGPLRYALRGLLEQTLPRLEVIDLGAVTYMSSRAVGVLLAHYQALAREGGKMRISRVQPNVRAVFKQMRLEMFIDVFDAVEEAVREDWD